MIFSLSGAGALGGTLATADWNSKPKNKLKDGLHCLIHQDGGQDTLDDPSILPFQIHAGDGNPLLGAQVKSGDVISTSDSIITLLIYDGTQITTPNVTILGYMQVFVRQHIQPGKFEGVIMNIAGCGSNAGSNPAISGGGISPIPVRLIHQ